MGSITRREWFDGQSEEPVDFYPEQRTVNVVQVGELSNIAKHITIATQTVGVFPFELKTSLRDELAVRGVDRFVNLGEDMTGGTSGLGMPHDGMIPLQRLIHGG